MAEQGIMGRLRWTATWTGLIPLAVTLLGGLVAGSWATRAVVGLAWFGCAFIIGAIWTRLNPPPPELPPAYQTAWEAIWNGEGLARAGHTAASAVLFVLWMTVNWIFIMATVNDVPDLAALTAGRGLRYIVSGIVLGLCILAVHVVFGRPISARSADPLGQSSNFGSL